MSSSLRLSPTIIDSLEEVLREIVKFAVPADTTLSRYFRDHSRLGGRERGVIAESVYGLLRNKAVYASMAESGSGSLMRRMALLVLADQVGVDCLVGITEQETEWLGRVMKIDRTSMPFELRVNLPEWLFKKIMDQLGEQGLSAFAQAISCAAPLDLRVNSIKADRESVRSELASTNIHAQPTPYAPDGLRILQKPYIQNLSLFKNGVIEVQDEGSQILVHIVGAKRGEMVVDFCAGAGGKTLALGAVMRNTGRLYAFDISEKRLAKLKPRLARSGLSNVHPALIAHERDAKIKRLAGKIDRVLVDAPCSGLGTLRRNPDVKWRQLPTAIAELTTKQSAILASAARLLKPGGRLIYATCSILREENEAIVEQFLGAHSEFELLPMREVLAEQKIALEMNQYLKLSPELHQTDGFFAAAFQRKSE